MRVVKILHVIDSGGLYGAEVMLLNLMHEQVRLGCNPALASIGTREQGEKPLETEARKRGFQVHTFRMLPGPNVPGALRIVKLAVRESFDLYHTHGYRSDILIGFLPRFIRRLPVVSTLHGWTNNGDFSRMTLYEYVDKISLRRIDRVVVVNGSMKNKVGLRGLRVVDNGIPVDDFEAVSDGRVTGGIDDDIASFCRKGFTFGAIGRLSLEKGFSNLIEAVKIASETYDIRLAIIGDGPLRKLLNDRIHALNLSGRVMLAGYRDGASKYLPCFKGFVLPSLTEGLPMVILEAMLASVPILATRVGGVPEVLENGDAGILLNTGSVQDIADGMIKFVANPDLGLRLAERARARVRDKYSSRLMAEKYNDIYRELVF